MPRSKDKTPRPRDDSASTAADAAPVTRAPKKAKTRDNVEEKVHALEEQLKATKDIVAALQSAARHKPDSVLALETKVNVQQAKITELETKIRGMSGLAWAALQEQQKKQAMEFVLLGQKFQEGYNLISWQTAQILSYLIATHPEHNASAIPPAQPSYPPTQVYRAEFMTTPPAPASTATSHPHLNTLQLMQMQSAQPTQQRMPTPYQTSSSSVPVPSQTAPATRLLVFSNNNQGQSQGLTFSVPHATFQRRS